MSEVLPVQHPAVVLRSHYVHLRALLGVTMIAVVGLTLALVIVASNSNTTTVSVANPASTPTSSIYNGGHNEASLYTRPATVRYDGGPEEGIAGH
jgi:hypothetical protein